MIEYCWYIDGRGSPLDQEIAQKWGRDVIRASNRLGAIETSPQSVEVVLRNFIPHLHGSLAQKYGLRKIVISCRDRKERRLICVHIPKDSPNRILILHHFIEKSTEPDYNRALKLAARRLDQIYNNEATYERKSIKETHIYEESQRIEQG